MASSYCRRTLRVVAAWGVIAVVGAAWFVPSTAQAQRYRGGRHEGFHGGGRVEGYRGFYRGEGFRGERGYPLRHVGYGRFGYGYGGYGGYAGYYPGAYYAPRPYLAAPPAVYLPSPVAVMPRVSYVVPGPVVRRAVHPATAHQVVAKPPCGCVAAQPAMPVAVAAPAPITPAAPTPVTPAPAAPQQQSNFEPLPSYAD